MVAAAEQSPLVRWLDALGAADAFSALADLIPQAAVFAVDERQSVVHWSRGAEALLGFSAAEVVGEHCLKSNRCHSCMVGCGIAEHGALSGARVLLHRKDGSPIPLVKHARAFFGPDGSFAGGVEVLVPDREAAVPAYDPRPGKVVNFHGLITRDFDMRRSLDIVRNVAKTDVPVLIRGESGSGKELIARGIHAESSRRGGPFVAINCAALPDALLESELFGHVRGAFTGAVRDHKGVFQQADGGTLFLDEVAELPLTLQAKLLRVLQEQTFLPVGASRPVTVDVRIVSATHRSLRQLVKDGVFREDLMYRLRVVPLFLPSLRERRDDIPLLLQHFIDERNARGGRAIERITPEAMRALLDYAWPGNVRELKNVIEYASAVGHGPELGLDDLPPEFREARQDLPAPVSLPLAGVGTSAQPQLPAGSSTPSLRPPRGLSEKQRLEWALEVAQGHIGDAAALLGMSRPTFWRKRKKYGLDSAEG